MEQGAEWFYGCQPGGQLVSSRKNGAKELASEPPKLFQGVPCCERQQSYTVITVLTRCLGFGPALGKSAPKWWAADSAASCLPVFFSLGIPCQFMSLRKQLITQNHGAWCLGSMNIIVPSFHWFPWILFWFFCLFFLVFPWSFIFSRPFTICWWFSSQVDLPRHAAAAPTGCGRGGLLKDAKCESACVNIGW